METAGGGSDGEEDETGGSAELVSAGTSVETATEEESDVILGGRTEAVCPEEKETFVFAVWSFAAEDEFPAKTSVSGF